MGSQLGCRTQSVGQQIQILAAKFGVAIFGAQHHVVGGGLFQAGANSPAGVPV